MIIYLVEIVNYLIIFSGFILFILSAIIFGSNSYTGNEDGQKRIVEENNANQSLKKYNTFNVYMEKLIVLLIVLLVIRFLLEFI